jgi:hypothetical protein
VESWVVSISILCFWPFPDSQFCGTSSIFDLKQVKMPKACNQPLWSSFSVNNFSMLYFEIFIAVVHKVSISHAV